MSTSTKILLRDSLNYIPPEIPELERLLLYLVFVRNMKLTDLVSILHLPEDKLWELYFDSIHHYTRVQINKLLTERKA